MMIEMPSEHVLEQSLSAHYISIHAANESTQSSLGRLQQHQNLQRFVDAGVIC